MSDGLAPRSFDYGKPAVVVQAFTYAGKDLAAGESFPYEDLKLERYQMQGLWMASLVDFVREPAIEEVAVAMPGVTTKAAADALDDAELERLTAPPASHSKRRGR